jgi:hypothetical protein
MAVFFEEFLVQVGVCPLYELTAGIIERFGCEKHFPQLSGFFHAFAGIDQNAGSNRVAIYLTFLDYYEGLEGKTVLCPWPRWMRSGF